MCACVVEQQAERGKFLNWKRRGMVRNGFSSNLAVIPGMPHSLGAEVSPPPHPILALGRGDGGVQRKTWRGGGGTPSSELLTQVL